MAWTLSPEGTELRRDQAGRLVKKMVLEAVYRRPRISIPATGHKIYPYLLRDRAITCADEVWCADITYIPMARGYAYLVAVMDWQSRTVLGWRLSNTMESGFCVEAFQMACRKTGKTPEIFNTDQCCQFASREWIGALEGVGVQVSMDGKGRWMDNVFIERLWRAVKHEGVYLWAYENLHELEKAGKMVPGLQQLETPSRLRRQDAMGNLSAQRRTPVEAGRMNRFPPPARIAAVRCCLPVPSLRFGTSSHPLTDPRDLPDHSI